MTRNHVVVAGVQANPNPCDFEVLANERRLLRAAARWNIPTEIALAVIARDARCFYCRRAFSALNGPRAQRPSWEHIVNDESLVGLDNIALCCIACNASKGTKPLGQWLTTTYCRDRAISSETLSIV